jgi:hypothetical protein
LREHDRGRIPASRKGFAVPAIRAGKVKHDRSRSRHIRNLYGDHPVNVHGAGMTILQSILASLIFNEICLIAFIELAFARVRS